MNIFRLVDRQVHHWMIGPHLHKLESLENTPPTHQPSNKNNNSNLPSGPVNTSFFPCVFVAKVPVFPMPHVQLIKHWDPTPRKCINGVNHHLRKRLSVILGRWCFFFGGGWSPRCFLHKFVFVPLGHEMFKTLLTWRMEEPNNLHKPFLTKYAYYVFSSYSLL